MRSLDEVLKDLKDAEKEYADKCLQYGIAEKKHKKKVEEEVPTDNVVVLEEENEQEEK